MFASSKSVSVSKRGQTSSHLKRLSRWCFWIILEMFSKWSFIKLHTQYLNHFSNVAFLFSIRGRRSNWSAIAFPSVPNPPHHHLCVVRRMLLLKLMFNTTRLYKYWICQNERIPINCFCCLLHTFVISDSKYRKFSPTMQLHLCNQKKDV